MNDYARGGLIALIVVIVLTFLGVMIALTGHTTVTVTCTPASSCKNLTVVVSD